VGRAEAVEQRTYKIDEKLGITNIRLGNVE